MLSFSIDWQLLSNICSGKIWSGADIWKRDTHRQRFVWKVQRCNYILLCLCNYITVASIAKAPKENSGARLHLQRKREWGQNLNFWLIDRSQNELPIPVLCHCHWRQEFNWLGYNDNIHVDLVYWKNSTIGQVNEWMHYSRISRHTKPMIAYMILT